jgi:hypothetical protein
VSEWGGSDPSGWHRLVKALEANEARASSRTTRVEQTLRSLGTTLQRILRKLNAREDSAVAPSGIDVQRVETLLAQGHFDLMDPREARFVARAFLHFAPEGVRKLLLARPHLLRTYVRSMLARWDASVDAPERWRAYANLVSEGAGDVVAGPVSIRELVSTRGARASARATAAKSLVECLRRLTEEWRYSVSWGVTSCALVAWLDEASAGDLDASVDLLVGDPEQQALRALLLPRPLQAGQPVGPRGSEVARATAIAVILKSRFPEARSIRRETFARVEPILLDGEFGDPRLVNVSNAWSRVERSVPSAYRAFVESLVREDLAFFFGQAMQAQDRREFWLRYLGSIRRSLCVLGGSAFRRIEAALAVGAEPEAARALQRAYRTLAGEYTSAFCLFFDSWVVVEFSAVGNAAYVYQRADFERVLLPRIIGDARKHEPRPSLSASTRDLKRRDVAFHRLYHHQGWQPTFESFLSQFGIVRSKITSRPQVA